MILLMVKVAPALLAGNTVVAKPAPTTPLTTLFIRDPMVRARCARRTGALWSAPCRS